MWVVPQDFSFLRQSKGMHLNLIGHGELFLREGLFYVAAWEWPKGSTLKLDKLTKKMDVLTFSPSCKELKQSRTISLKLNIL